MTAAAVDRAARRVARSERRLRSGRLALLTAVLAAAAAVAVSVPLALALCVGAGFEVALLVAIAARRRALIARLAVEPDAYAIPAVRDYGVALAGPRQRERLAGWLAEVLDEADHPESLYLADRVSQYAAEIRAVATGLQAPGALVQPVSAAACRRLLTVAVESPLYNPHLPAVDLGSALFRIHAGIRRPA